MASLGSPVAGKQVTVDLAGDAAREVDRVQVSAMLRPPLTGDPDAGAQARVSALRQFRVLACMATPEVDCADAAEFSRSTPAPPTRSPRSRRDRGRRN